MKRKKTPKDVLENIRWFSKFPLEKRLGLGDRINELLELKRLGYNPKDTERLLSVELGSRPKDLEDIQYLEGLKQIKRK